jgi:hypothetical protein
MTNEERGAVIADLLIRFAGLIEISHADARERAAKLLEGAVSYSNSELENELLRLGAQLARDLTTQ